MCHKSESIKELAIALVKFNGEVSKIDKDSVNPHFKNNYASLDNIIDEIRPILTKHGLAIIQMPGGDGEKFTMTTMLVHESGEWIESQPIVMRPVKNDPQGIGSCATYARRYSLAAFLSLNTGEDDDGNGATNPTHPKTSQEVGQERLAQEQAKANQRQQNVPAASTGNTGATTARVYKLREELGWGWPDLNLFAGDVLHREIKFLKTDVKSPEEWAEIEKAMIVTRDASKAS